jgi:K+-transporting ATPase ATPase B chain
MFVVYVGSILTTLLWIQALAGKGEAPGWFIFWVSVWLWFTVLFANFAEAMAEGRGKAQAASLRKARRDLQAKRLARPHPERQRRGGRRVRPPQGGRVLVEAGDLIPADGEVIEGVASVNEAAITGESAPVIRESGGRSQLRHRGDAGALGLAPREGDRRPGRGVPGPHDLAGRGRQAAEDPRTRSRSTSCSPR